MVKEAANKGRGVRGEREREREKKGREGEAPELVFFLLPSFRWRTSICYPLETHNCE